MRIVSKYYAMRDGTDLHVRTIGRGKPVMVLHGFGMESWQWIPLVFPLINEYKFILPDLRGFGRSASIPLYDNDVFRVFYTDIEDIMDHMGLNKIPFVGISMGAYAILYYLTQSTIHRVEKFLCIDQPPFVKNISQHNYGIGINKHEEWMSLIDELLQETEKYPDIKNHHELPKEIQHKYISLLGEFICASIPNPYAKKMISRILMSNRIQALVIPEGCFENWIKIVRANLKQEQYNLLYEVEKIDIPVTIMTGLKNEMFSPEGSYYLHTQINGSVHIPFEKSGHSLIYSEPIKFIKELKRFLYT